MEDIRQRDPSPPSLLVAAHCSTIERKAKHLDINELSAILDDFVRELNNNTLRSETYLNSLNEIVKILNSNLPPILLEINSHYFFILIRNTIRNLLQKLCLTKQLNDQEIYVLRNCVLLIHYLVKNLKDISKILHWITDPTFLDALANCLNIIKKISKKDQNKHVIRQLTRLLNIFCNIQECLPLDLHGTLFVRLLQPTIDCLTSSKYVKLFQQLKPNNDSFTEKQKLFLIKCPFFLTTYYGPHLEKAIEQVLEIMLPRYVSILDKHMKTIKEWKRPIMRAVHNLIITIAYAEGYFSIHTNTESFRSLINHLLNILNEPALINKIQPNSNNMETLLIDATLVVFSVLVYESNALDYIKKRKPIEIFRQLTKIPHETIVLNAYMMLAYTMGDYDIKTSQDDLTQLLSTIFNVLQKTIETYQQMNIDENHNRENIDRHILQLLETLKGLVQYEQIRNEILKQNLLPFLIDSYTKLHGLSKQTLLECLWKLSFNEQIAQQLREHTHFILSLENIPKPVNDNIPQNAIRRSNSYSSRRNSTSIVVIEATNFGIQKVADGLLWKVVEEPQFREKIIEKMTKSTEINVASGHQKYKYDIMISYCYADKDIVYKIQQFLVNEGYHIWFDLDYNNGQAMEIVAEAIENSEFVIICMSDSYKRDNHCQAQAEYALICKRLILPLIAHKGYKPDGWLSSIISHNVYIQFGTSNFKAASELLLREIKRRGQHKKEILDVESMVSTSVNIVHNPSIPLTVPDETYIPIESPALNEATTSAGSSIPSTIVNGQQQTATRSISRPPTPGADISATSPLIDRQQQGSTYSISRPPTPGADISATSSLIDRQQQGSIRSTPRPPTPVSIYTVAPIVIFKQQQAPIQRVFTPPISNSIPSGASTVVNKQQRPTTPMLSTSRPSTPGSIASTTSSFNDKLQQQISMHSISISPTTNSISSAASIVVDEQQPQQQQQQIIERRVLRPLTPSSISSDSSVTTEKHRQPTLVHPVSELSIPGTNTFTTSTVIDKQQQQRPIQPVSRSPVPDSSLSTASAVVNKEPPQESVNSISQPLIPASTSSTTTRDLDKQQQQTTLHSILKPSTPAPIASDASVNIEKKQQQEHQLTYSATRSLTNDTAPFVTSVTVNKEQQQQPRMRPISRSPTSSSTSSDQYVNGEKQQQQKASVQPVSQSSTTNTVFPATSTVVTEQQHQTSVQPNSKSTVPGPVRSVVSVIDNKQQQTPIHLISRSPVLDSAHSAQKSSISMTGPSATSVNIEKQQQQRIPSRSNSRPTTPARLPVASSINSTVLTSSQSNGHEHSRLPEEYTNRKTHNSIYRTISANAWRNNDVLDFLFDTNLYTMMPLCESMSGKALIRLFRMCQRKPSRLYDQLNEELRVRFKGLTLPMGVYTQFLIEMDALVGPTPDALSLMSDPAPKVVERVIYMPHTIQQQEQQPIAMQPPPRPSTVSAPSSNQSKTVTSVEAISGTTMPRSTRFVERAVYRPASNIGRPYNFIIESVEESTVLLDQVQRYGNQLLLLDETARQHREINGIH